MSFFDSIFLMVVYDIILSNISPEEFNNFASIKYIFGSVGDHGLKSSFESLIEIYSLIFPLLSPTNLLLYFAE